MSRISHPVDAWAGIDDDAAQSLADDNLGAQEHLWESLAAARRASGLTDEQVAERLGVTAELANAIGEGRIDITLGDLREFAYAVDAVVAYKVSPRYTTTYDTFRRSLVGELPWHTPSQEEHGDDDEVNVRRRAEMLTGGH
ncbi:helix-turn-helix domain-containing protein [Arthrobacter sp. FW306-2-2C-D06B]|uniref:helix-turn-helix domain-containing protein n=1 Tax=Arthrobacter sp. FW306-2-2C-D06B TaxID=2879618 RepID=UPI001F2DD7B0|nr:helix-turn-helix transcriptional regulator [Arthrobacter sp. FW306-2-2C-D06B]UKA57510.1 helix-turn-helix transcriptional regulator [Arthrobacter sp. FW306-2-2C-D06B]